MQTLRLVIALPRLLALLGTNNPPLKPPGEGERRSNGRCPKHGTELRKHLRGYWCPACERYIPKDSRRP
jgi:hypothetical protein